MWAEDDKMCGIAGVWKRDGSLLGASDLRPLLDRMRHRGPDDEGCLVIESATGKATPLAGVDTPAELQLANGDLSAARGDLLLGHRRLSILDLSPRGHQPMSTPDGRMWIAFNGEIYNYIELRAELQALGHEFQSGTDTEVILHAWVQWGSEALHRFNGDWAFALADLRETGNPVLWLARDRWGVKPLFVVERDRELWFASEAKALLGYAAPFAPSREAVLKFLAMGALPPGDGAKTFFEGIEQLPPGHALRATQEGSECTAWYDLRKATQSQEELPEEEAIRALGDEVTRAVKLRLRADVPVGSCLSGGVDSTSIVGTMSTLLKQDGAGAVHTFSAVYRQQGSFNEVDWIRDAVKHSSSTPHETFPDEQPLVEIFDRMVWHQDEPFQTASIFAQWCVMQEARSKGVIVMLDGQAADELFGGYQPGTYQEQFLEWLGKGRWMMFAKEWLARRRATGLPWSTVWKELKLILHSGSVGTYEAPRPLGEMAEHYRAIGLNEAAVAALAPDPAQLRAKLTEELEKRERLAMRSQKSPEDKELAERVRVKETQILSLRQKLARFSRGSAWEALRVAWGRLRGKMPHDFRAYLLRQTLNESLPNLLRFEDRNSMAHSVEARVPFTDVELVEWAFRRVNKVKIREGWTKWVLRKAMHGRAPESILWRRDKVGFEAPDASMTALLLRDRAEKVISSAYLREFLDEKIVRELIARVVEGKATRDESRVVWRWLVLESWHRQCSEAAEVPPGGR
jgi:asparagine synthase (glutamine-hydrolysing)